MSFLKKPLLSFSLLELSDWLIEHEERSFRAKQIFEWIYQKKILNFEQMINLSRQLREKLKNNFILPSLKLKQVKTSKDQQTLKFLFGLTDGRLIEAVLIRSFERNTVCVSSQVGCRGNCLFCASGKQGFFRNLETAEIIEQILLIGNYLNDPKCQEQEDYQDHDLNHKETAKQIRQDKFEENKSVNINNIVFMGMGEPLDNFENVVKAIEIISSKHGYNISQRRISLSTAGIIDKIKKLLEKQLKINLVLSLHAADQKLREKLIPLARLNPLDQLLDVMAEYVEKTSRNITFEYILLQNLNDQKKHAGQLVEKLKKFSHFSINLIPYNPIIVDSNNIKKDSDFKESQLARPSNLSIQKFKKQLLNCKIPITQRYAKGQDIAAACGQLAGNK